MTRVYEAMRRAAARAEMSDAAEAGAPDRRGTTDACAVPPQHFPTEAAEQPAEPARSERRRPVSPLVTKDAAAHGTSPDDGAALFERVDASLAGKVVIDSHMASASREQYRRLAAALHHAQEATGLKVVMIASAVPGEGKTLTASNLALTLSESYRRSVLLVDGDLRRPTLHTVFHVDNSGGLTEGLSGRVERLPVHRVSQTLAVLTAGKASSDPMAGLTSERMRRLIDESRDIFDWIIVDTPPLALLPDANLLAAMVDTAILVVKAGTTPYDLVKRAVDSVGRDRILGTVLNQADTQNHAYGYERYDHYYGRTSSKP